ncbi:MAG: CBS domain-containing protein [Candidatus Bathycorpusculaceae bacterium]
MRVKEIMDEKYPSIYEDEPATKARALIRDLKLRILPVTDENRKILGVVSRNAIMAISSSVSPITVKGIIENPRYIATVDTEVTLAIREMIRLDEWYVPVTDSHADKSYRGVLGLENFIETVIKTSPEKLAKPVSDVMSTNVVACTPEDEVDNIWRLMQTKSFAGLPVVKKGRLVGIVTQKDLLESGALLPTFESSKGRFRASRQISSIMKTGVITVKPSTKLIRVAKVMVFKNIGRVPVVDEERRLIGIIDREDVARLLVK